MILFNGKHHSKVLETRIKESLFTINPFNKLAIVMIGEDPASQKYVSLKENTCNRLGIKTFVELINQNQDDKAIFSRVKDIFNDNQVSGGIIQLPLPRKSLKSVLGTIPLEKDIDMISSKSMRRFYSDDFSKLSPVVRSLEYFLAVNEVNTQDLAVTVIGNGFLVGRPVSYFLLEKGAKVTVLDSMAFVEKDKNSVPGLPVTFNQINYRDSYNKGDKLGCDLLVLSAGVPNLVNGEALKEGCHVVDFGSAVVNGKTVGDFDLESDLGHLGVISPSPGGMGPLVVRFLIMNFLGI